MHFSLKGYACPSMGDRDTGPSSRYGRRRDAAGNAEDEDEAFLYIGVMFYKRVDGENDIAARRAIEDDSSGWMRRLMVRATNFMTYQHAEPVFHIKSVLPFIKDRARREEALAALADTGLPSVYAYGVMGGDPVFGHPRTFASPNYDYVAIMIDAPALERAVTFCERQVGKPADDTGAIRSLCFPKTSDGRSWFCAELTIACLQQVGIMRGVDPAATTIDQIYDILSTHPARMRDMSPLMVSIITRKTASSSSSPFTAASTPKQAQRPPAPAQRPSTPGSSSSSLMIDLDSIPGRRSGDRESYVQGFVDFVSRGAASTLASTMRWTAPAITTSTPVVAPSSTSKERRHRQDGHDPV